MPLRVHSLLGPVCAASLSWIACGGVEVQPGTDATTGQDPDARPGEPDPPDASIGGPDARPASCEDGVTQLLYNPSFEEAVNPDGAVGWSEQSAEGEHLTFPEDQLGGFAVFEGNRAAWLGRAFEDDQRLSQRVAVPAATTELTLSFYRCFTTDEDTEDVYDTLDVSLLDAGGAALGPALVSYDNLIAGESCSWDRVEIDIEAVHAGEEISLLLRANTDEDILTSFFFDAVALTAFGPCPDDAVR